VLFRSQTLRQSIEAVEIGADVIVAQGTEAGGHGAARSTLALVPAVVDAVRNRNHDIPVVAAGGIADGRGLAAALMLGADGVLMGTRFYASEESLAAREAKMRVVAAEGDRTLRTQVFDIVRRLDWPAPYTGRALANGFSEQWHGREEDLGRSLKDEAERYARAADAKEFETAVIFAGEAVDLIYDMKPAADIVRAVIQEAEAALARKMTV
jgi:nitronate monooxygenase